jgi:hypothetical protein
MCALGIYKFIIFNKDKNRFEISFVPDNSFTCGYKLTLPMFKLIINLGKRTYSNLN